MIDDDTKQEIISALKHYLLPEYALITDFDKVVDNREELIIDVNGESKTLYKYPCPIQTIYLDLNNYPYTIGNQRVVNDEYYYNFEEDVESVETAETYTYINTTEWKRTPETESWMSIFH